MVEFQIRHIGGPVVDAREMGLPAAVVHFVEQLDRLLLCVVEVGGADDKGGEVEHDKGVFFVEEVLDVVLPGVGGGGAVEGW